MGVKVLKKLVSTERKMLRMMRCATLRDRISTSEVVESVGVESIGEWLRRQRLDLVWACIERG